MKLKSQIVIQNWDDGRTTLQFTRGEDQRAEKMQTTIETGMVADIMSRIVDYIWQGAFRESQAFRSTDTGGRNVIESGPPLQLDPKKRAELQAQWDRTERTETSDGTHGKPVFAEEVDGDTMINTEDGPKTLEQAMRDAGYDGPQMSGPEISTTEF